MHPCVSVAKYRRATDSQHCRAHGLCGASLSATQCSIRPYAGAGGKDSNRTRNGCNRIVNRRGYVVLDAAPRKNTKSREASTVYDQYQEMHTN